MVGWNTKFRITSFAWLASRTSQRHNLQTFQIRAQRHADWGPQCVSCPAPPQPHGPAWQWTARWRTGWAGTPHMPACTCGYISALSVPHCNHAKLLLTPLHVLRCHTLDVAPVQFALLCLPTGNLNYLFRTRLRRRSEKGTSGSGTSQRRAVTC